MERHVQINVKIKLGIANCRRTGTTGEYLSSLAELSRMRPKDCASPSPFGRRWPEGPDEGRSFALTRRFAAPSPRGRGTSRKSMKSCRPLPKEKAEPSAIRFGTRTRLPQDFLDKAVNRLGMLGLLSAAAHPLFHYGTRALMPEDILRATQVPPGYFVAMSVAIISGLVIFALTRSGKLKPDLMLDIGLIFEVVGALCIGLIEAPRVSGTHVDAGPAGIALWITLFVLVVPNTLGKTA